MIPSSTTSVRRSRFILLLLVAGGILLYFRSSFDLSEFGANLSRASIASAVKDSSANVDEIYGLIHLATGDAEHQHVLGLTAGFDPTVPQALDTYAAGDKKKLNWQKEKQRIDKAYPVVVFSKSYCPYSKKAKELLKTYQLSPPPKIIEVDLRVDSDYIKSLLARLTDHSTFPNIIIQGKTIRGSDNLQTLHQDKLLRKIFEKVGVTVGGKDIS